jgi:hypothetical protein
MSSIGRKRRTAFKVRAALGARLALIEKLANGPPQSISRLAQDST